MASLLQHEDVYHVCFRVGSTQFRRSLETTCEKEAKSRKGRIESTLHDIKVGKLPIPDGCDVGMWVLSDGKATGKVVAPDNTTLGELTTRYLAEKIGLEETTLKTTRVHIKHLIAHFGVKHIVEAIDHDALQGYANARGRKVKGATVKKEIGTFSALWSWGCNRKLIKGECGCAGLEYKKGEEKPPFATWDEIVYRIKKEKLVDGAADALWDCLWLDEQQVTEFLHFAEGASNKSYFYPLMMLVAHTGARRSEAIRSKIGDFDFTNKVVRLREKKKDKTTVTYRNVFMTGALKSVMRKWLDSVDGGFTRPVMVDGKEVMESGFVFPVDVDPASDEFNRVTAKTKWEHLKGFHVFRHSVASNLARRGVADRYIDAILGHQTEAMRKRYQHLHPAEKANLMHQMFAISA